MSRFRHATQSCDIIARAIYSFFLELFFFFLKLIFYQSKSLPPRLSVYLSCPKMPPVRVIVGHWLTGIYFKEVILFYFIKKYIFSSVHSIKILLTYWITKLFVAIISKDWTLNTYLVSLFLCFYGFQVFFFFKNKLFYIFKLFWYINIKNK